MAVDSPRAKPDPAKSIGVAAMIGVGAMAAVDEIVFHQLLGWHHFYDRATPAIGLLTDGLLHSAELILLVAGFFLLADLHARRVFIAGSGWGGFFIGAGGFQLFDGLIDHKVLRLHQIRYGIDHLLTYDLLWNAAGALLLLIGVALTRHRLRSGGPPG
jgi:uncharacterized membrane protein